MTACFDGLTLWFGGMAIGAIIGAWFGLRRGDRSGYHTGYVIDLLIGRATARSISFRVEAPEDGKGHRPH